MTEYEYVTDSVTIRSLILSCQRSPYLIDIQRRRRRPFVGYFIGIHGESRGLQLTSGTSLYNKQRKDKVRISIVEVTKWRHRLGYGIYEAANYK